MTKDITDKQVWSTKQLVIIVVTAITITFTVALVYSEFIIHGTKIQVLEDRMDKRYERTNENLNNIWAEVNKLKEKGTDE